MVLGFSFFCSCIMSVLLSVTLLPLWSPWFVQPASSSCVFTQRMVSLWFVSLSVFSRLCLTSFSIVSCMFVFLETPLWYKGSWALALLWWFNKCATSRQVEKIKTSLSKTTLNSKGQKANYKNQLTEEVWKLNSAKLKKHKEHIQTIWQLKQ